MSSSSEDSRPVFLSTDCSLRDVLTILFKRRRLISSFCAVVITLAALRSFLADSVYEASATVLVKKSTAEVPIVPSQSSQLIISQITEQDLNSEMEILRSRQLVEEVLGLLGVDESSRPKDFVNLALGRLRGALEEHPEPIAFVATTPPRSLPPSAPSQTARKPVAGRVDTEPGHREYDRLAQRIQGLLPTQQPRAVLVAAAVAGEGASTVARKLAFALGQRPGSRLLLLDANLRSPSQHTAFRVTRVGGFSDVVAGTMPLEIGCRTVSTGLQLMTCGSPVRNARQLLGLPELCDTLRDLRLRFDWIVVDAPPITEHADATTLAQACDGVVLVLKAERTRWQVAEEARRLLEGSGARLLGADRRGDESQERHRHGENNGCQDDVDQALETKLDSPTPSVDGRTRRFRHAAQLPAAKGMSAPNINLPV
jgi:capsular exopolysaccharide synthesis family protein